MYDNLKYLLLAVLLIVGVLLYKYPTSNNSPSIDEIDQNMVIIPGGKFLMGSDGAEALPNEMPVHEVIVDSCLLIYYFYCNST